MIITIDGKSCTGKSTIALLLSKKINFSYINSGLLYRAITHEILKNKIDLINFKNKEEQIKLLINHYNFDLQKINENISIFKTIEISKFGTEIAKLQFVRDKVNDYISEINSKYKNIIIEGRDIGTKVFPNADFKFFFIADIDIRANRLALERNSKEINKIKIEIQKRDLEDENRKNSPLKKAISAILIDTSKLTIEETVNILEQHLK
ncbi:(d)CMP kinase [Flavobacterium crassostreae]|uniref:Cytidylate kinase n=1 Tax=Flavobacterium crassostreae TaxID=1763534 RepID=A0A1B9E074_9FLAO|nr:(d)CMP kinase [Flavobacterium crassostreae]OCB75317.1 hypothetical protein LPBF_08645 [Flavobacterium crassostreae]